MHLGNTIPAVLTFDYSPSKMLEQTNLVLVKFFFLVEGGCPGHPWDRINMRPIEAGMMRTLWNDFA
jgi:hypothetical protein